MSVVKKKTKGGRREGAGRKLHVPVHLKKEGFYVKLPRWLKAWLTAEDRHQSAAVMIEEALREKHGLTPPDPDLTERSANEPN